MLNSFTYDRAMLEIDAIEARGVASGARLVQLSGAVGGRASNPEMVWTYAVRYTSPTGPSAGECLKFWPGDDFRDAHRSLYVVDGVGMYVAGWQGADDGTVNALSEGWVVVNPIHRTFNYGMVPRRRAYVLTSTPV